MKTYTKINTLYKRYDISKDSIPEKKWMAMKSKIILGDFSDPWAAFLWDCKFDCFSKIDGTNTRLIWFPGKQELIILGKTDDSDPNQFGTQDFFMPIREDLKQRLQTLFPNPKYVQTLDPETKLPLYHDDQGNSIVKPQGPGTLMADILEEPVIVYGEYYGKGIGQAGKQYGEKSFRVFDVYAQGWWYPIDMMKQTAEFLGFEIAPYIGQLSLREAEERVKAGFKTLVPGVSNPEYIEEGIVARPVIPLFDGRKNRIIVKIKTKDYADLERGIKEMGGQEEYEKFKSWYNDRR